MKRLLLAAGVLLGAWGWAQAAEIPNQAVIANETALAYNNTYYLDISQAGRISMQVVAGSATVAAGTFSDGSVSTKTITVVSYTALSSATATAAITISSNSQTARTCVSGGGPGLGQFNVCNPADWQTDSASSQTAANLATAINTAFGVTFATSAIGPIVYTTAPYAGSAWNSFTIAVSSYGAETLTTFVSSIPYQVGYSSRNGVGIGHLTGGQDNQTILIGTKTFTANRDFYPVTSNAQTATNLAAAINGGGISLAAAAGSASTAIVFATATVVGTATNYAVVSSSNPALSLSGTVTLSGSQGTSAMTGGAGAAYTINTSTITIASNAFTQGLAVVYSTGSTTVLNGLTYGTTYFVCKTPLSGSFGTGQFALSTTLANALAGTVVQLASSQTATTANTYNLIPAVIAGTPSMKWIVSNDRTNWTTLTTSVQNVTVSSLSLTSFTAGGATTIWDPGQIDYNWLGLSVVAPTTGGITLKATVGAKP